MPIIEAFLCIVYYFFCFRMVLLHILLHTELVFVWHRLKARSSLHSQSISSVGHKGLCERSRHFHYHHDDVAVPFPLSNNGPRSLYGQAQLDRVRREEGNRTANRRPMIPESLAKSGYHQPLLLFVVVVVDNCSSCTSVGRRCYRYRFSLFRRCCLSLFVLLMRIRHRSAYSFFL